jgi:hypothetical protein
MLCIKDTLLSTVILPEHITTPCGSYSEPLTFFLQRVYFFSIVFAQDYRAIARECCVFIAAQGNQGRVFDFLETVQRLAGRFRLPLQKSLFLRERNLGREIQPEGFL